MLLNQVLIDKEEERFRRRSSKNVLKLLKNDAEQTYRNYETMLNEKYDGSKIDESSNGLARELARMNLTLNTYTQWYWKTDFKFNEFLKITSRQCNTKLELTQIKC